MVMLVVLAIYVIVTIVLAIRLWGKPVAHKLLRRLVFAQLTFTLFAALLLKLSLSSVIIVVVMSLVMNAYGYWIFSKRRVTHEAPDEDAT